MTGIPDDIADTIVDPKAYADGKRIDEAFTWLRKNAPLSIARPRDYDPFWVVTRHADILQVERQNDLFSSSVLPAVLATPDAIQNSRGPTGGGKPPLRTLVQMDNPEHMAYRRLTQSWFMPRDLRGIEARVREIARGFVDRMAGLGDRCDFARDVAFLYPLNVIMEVLGVPERDEPLMLKLTQELFGIADPDHNESRSDSVEPEAAVDTVQSVIANFLAYFNGITEDRRANPRTDLASVIANGLIEGQPIGHLEAISYYVIVATAGHDTTSASIAGGLWALAENPAEFAKVKADPALIPGLVEESIRWITPVKHFMRTATTDIELSGQKISKGDWLFLSYPSGNRDEAVFDDPFSFRVDRSPNKHVAFGYGAHLCLGQHLARMEMRILWEELLPRLASVELDGEPKRMAANFVCGPKSVPIRFAIH